MAMPRPPFALFYRIFRRYDRMNGMAGRTATNTVIDQSSTLGELVSSISCNLYLIP